MVEFLSKFQVNFLPIDRVNSILVAKSVIFFQYLTSHCIVSDVIMSYRFLLRWACIYFPKSIYVARDHICNTSSAYLNFNNKKTHASLHMFLIPLLKTISSVFCQKINITWALHASLFVGHRHIRICIKCDELTLLDQDCSGLLEIPLHVKWSFLLRVTVPTITYLQVMWQFSLTVTVRCQSLFVDNHCSLTVTIRWQSLFVDSHCSLTVTVYWEPLFVNSHCSDNNLLKYGVVLFILVLFPNIHIRLFSH